MRWQNLDAGGGAETSNQQTVALLTSELNIKCDLFSLTIVVGYIRNRFFLPPLMQGKRGKKSDRICS